MSESSVEKSQRDANVRIKEERKSDDSSNDERTMSVSSKAREKLTDEIEIKKEKNSSDGELTPEFEMIPPNLLKKEPKSPIHSSRKKRKSSPGEDEIQQLKKVKELEKTLKEKRQQAKVVDDLFKKFITSKMKEVEQERKKKKRVKKEKKKGYPDEVSSLDEDKSNERKKKKKKVKVKKERKSKTPDEHLNVEVKHEKDNWRSEDQRLYKEGFRENESSDYYRYSNRYEDSYDCENRDSRNQHNQHGDKADRNRERFQRRDKDREREKFRDWDRESDQDRERDEYSEDFFEKRRNSSRNHYSRLDKQLLHRDDRYETYEERSNLKRGTESRRQQDDSRREYEDDRDMYTDEHLTNRRELTRYENSRNYGRDEYRGDDTIEHNDRRSNFRHSRIENERNHDYERSHYDTTDDRERSKRHENSDSRQDYDRYERTKTRNRDDHGDSRNSHSRNYPRDQREVSDNFQREYRRDQRGWTKEQYHQESRKSHEKTSYRDDFNRKERSDNSYRVRSRESSEKRTLAFEHKIRRGDHSNPPLFPPVKLLPLHSGRKREQDYSAVPPCGYENVIINQTESTSNQGDNIEQSQIEDNQTLDDQQDNNTFETDQSKQEQLKKCEEFVNLCLEESRQIDANKSPAEKKIIENSDTNKQESNVEEKQAISPEKEIMKSSVAEICEETEKINSSNATKFNKVETETQENTETVLKAVEDEKKTSNENGNQQKEKEGKTEKIISIEKATEKETIKISEKKGDNKSRRERSKDKVSSRKDKRHRHRTRSRSGSRRDQGTSRSSRRRRRHRSDSEEKSQGKSGWDRNRPRSRDRQMMYEFQRTRSSKRRRSSRSSSEDKHKERHKEEYFEKQFSRAPPEGIIAIDKDKLREIAIKNAHKYAKKAALKPEEIAKLTQGKSIDELTSFCKTIADTRLSSSEDEKQEVSDDDMTAAVKVKESNSIVMNIRNSRQLPALTPVEKAHYAATLRLQFPVSSGNQHRTKEHEEVRSTENVPGDADNVEQDNLEKEKSIESEVDKPEEQKALVSSTDTSVFPDVSSERVDISKVVAERLSAMRKLQQNPNDSQAISEVYKSQEKVSLWAQSKNLPGQFLGSTGVQPLSAKELNANSHQAWLKKVKILVLLV